MGRVHSPILVHACTFSNICSWQARASYDEHVTPVKLLIRQDVEDFNGNVKRGGTATKKRSSDGLIRRL